MIKKLKTVAEYAAAAAIIVSMLVLLLIFDFLMFRDF